MIDLSDLVKDDAKVTVGIEGDDFTYWSEMKGLGLAMLKLFIPFRLLKAIFEVFAYIGGVFFATVFLVFLPVVALIVYRFRKTQMEHLKQEVLSSFLKQ